jgi:hypothetical protein
MEAERMADDYAVFMQTDLSPYIGEWVAICDGKIVAHDVSLKKTHEIAASKCPKKAPLFTKVPSSDAMIFSEVA